MKIQFVLADGTAHTFCGSEIKFASAPTLKTSYSIYKDIIHVPNMRFDFVYNESFKDGFLCFLSTNLHEIEKVHLYSNSGILFSGVIDYESDIEIADNRVGLDFIQEISPLLDIELPSGAYISCTPRPLHQLWGVQPVGAGVMEEIINRFIDTYMPGFTTSFPDDFMLLQPFHWIVDTKLGNMIENYEPRALGLRLYFGNLSISEALKLICMAGNCRVTLHGNEIIFVSYASEGTVTPDGEIAKSGISISKEQRNIDRNVEARIRMSVVYESVEGHTQDRHYDEIQTRDWFEEYYDKFGVISYSEHSFIGLNSNLHCGDRFRHDVGHYIISEIERDCGMIDLSLQPIRISALEV